MNAKIAVIGGTGFYDPGILDNAMNKVVNTIYGNAKIKIGYCQGKPVAFMNRHGGGHSIPPHLVNYRANIAALRKIGVRNIIAIAAVGSMNPAMQPGHHVFVDQFLDFTGSRQHTFFNRCTESGIHLDMTNPYCPELREILFQASHSLGITSHQTGTYVCCEGPRFETTAEIKMYRMLGGDLVGMTGVPEVTLAREAKICYATIAIVTNYAAGISLSRLTQRECVEVMTQSEENIRKLLIKTISWINYNRSCSCNFGSN